MAWKMYEEWWIYAEQYRKEAINQSTNQIQKNKERCQVGRALNKLGALSTKYYFAFWGYINL